MSVRILTPALLFIFAIALQIQLTLFASDDYIGLRVNLADFLVPLAGLFILSSLLFKRSLWPRWGRPFGYWAPALLSLIIGLGLMNGYLLQGEWSRWALVNKGVGWAVLMAYLLAGAWLSTNAPVQIQRFFILPFVGFVVVVTLAESIIRGLYHLDVLPSLAVFGYRLGYDLAGFMANRNAFAFLYLCALVLSSFQLLGTPLPKRFEKLIYSMMWFLLPVFLTMNLSRTALPVVAMLVVYLLVKYRGIFLKSCLPLLVCGLVLMPLSDNSKVSQVFLHLTGISQMADHIDDADAIVNKTSNGFYRGDALRLLILTDAVSLLRDHPFTGAGIGAALSHQDQEQRTLVSVIDNTPLWILTEMGPFGLLGFGGVYVCMLMALKRRADQNIGEQPFAIGLIGILLAFGVYSLLHEILYTRFLWFVLGLGLAAPAIAHPQRQDREARPDSPEEPAS